MEAFAHQSDPSLDHALSASLHLVEPDSAETTEFPSEAFETFQRARAAIVAAYKTNPSGVRRDLDDLYAQNQGMLDQALLVTLQTGTAQERREAASGFPSRRWTDVLNIVYKNRASDLPPGFFESEPSRWSGVDRPF